MDSQMENETANRLPGCGVAVLALAGASVLVAGGLTAAMGFGSAYPYALMVTLGIVAVIGGPAFMGLREQPTWRRVVIAGFATGALFPAVFGLAGLARPLEYLTVVGGFGVAGIVGAMITWLLVKWLLIGGLGAKTGVALLIAAGVAAMWAVPWALMDRSCHNTLRDGRDSIGPVADVKLHVPMSEWRAVQLELEQFARENDWQTRADVRPDPGFRWFQVSLCREPGTNIFVSRDYFDEERMSISVYQPQGGDSWEAPLRMLQDQLERRWPGKTGYDYGEHATPRPPWAPPSPSDNAPLRASEKSL
jgi:hypothetical protein